MNRKGNRIESTWYTNATVSLIMNFHSLAPKKYKRSVISGFVHRIYKVCSTWANFHKSLDRAKIILNKNLYPESFYEPIIHETLTNIFESKRSKEPAEEEPDSTST